MTLKAGNIIAKKTPTLVSMGLKPSLILKEVAMVELSIKGLVKQKMKFINT